MRRNHSPTDVRGRAYALLPELTDHPAPERRWHSVVLLVVTTLVAVLVLGLISVGTWRWTTREQVGPQYQTTAPVLPAGLTDDMARSVATAPPTAAPIVLTYHDVTAKASKSIYRVTSTNFAAQMKVLHDAGYQTLTAAQFADYAKGGAPPPRSVLLTFDDGTAGDWTYVDHILKKYSFHAIAFMVTGRIGKHAPYYLSWPQMRSMQASGRWDFESHTHDLHEQVVTGPNGRHGSRLMNQVYSNGRQQSLAAFKSSVTSDLQASITDLTSHGFPRPTMFAYPFSELTRRTANVRAASFTRDLVQRLFPYSFVDSNSGPMPASRSAMASRPIQRMEVFSRDTARSVFDRVTQMETIPVSSLDPARVSGRWLEVGGYPAPVVQRGDGVTLEAESLRYISAGWEAQRTSDWADYVVRADVTGLRGQNSGALVVRWGSAAAVSIRFSRNSVTVARVSTNAVLSVTKLQPGAAHHVDITVRAGVTTFVADGTSVATVRAPTGVSAYGGIGITAFRQTVQESFPVFSTLRITPVAP